MPEKRQLKIRRYNIKQAQAHFERLLREARAGDEVVLMRRSKPVGQLLPVRREKKSTEPT